jgi:hypothetical protein
MMATSGLEETKDPSKGMISTDDRTVMKMMSLQTLNDDHNDFPRAFSEAAARPCS